MPFSMSPRFLMNCVMFVCSAAAFFYGIFRYYGKNVPLYIKAVVTGMGCLAGGRFATVILMFSGAFVGNRFHIGHLGFIGFSLFLFTALHGELDAVYKEEAIGKGRFRCIGYIAPLVLLVFLGYVLAADNCTIFYKGVCCLFSVYIFISAFYNLRYLLNPTRPDGIICSLRLFNLVCLLMDLSVMAEMYLWTTERTVMMVPAYAVMGGSTLLLIPCMEKSRKVRGGDGE